MLFLGCKHGRIETLIKTEKATDDPADLDQSDCDYYIPLDTVNKDTLQCQLFSCKGCAHSDDKSEPTDHEECLGCMRNTTDKTDNYLKTRDALSAGHALS